ncbi:MAG: glycosyltransferase [Phycisphaeraceae bacterium]|nr:glycosyltransferase [Phycisphaeraceae bacterium]
MHPRTSYIIPAYNAEETIGEAMASVLSQSGRDLELIVVDDGSTDATFVAASAVRDARVRVVRSANRGVGAARNTGLRMAAGERICFVDSDDAIESVFDERMNEGARQNPVTFCGMRYCRPDLEPSGWEHLPDARDWEVSRLARFNQFAIGGLIFDGSFLRALDEKYGGAFPEGSPAEDWEFLLRCAHAGAHGVTVVDSPLYRYRLRPDSRSTAYEPLWRAGLEIIERWCGDDKAIAEREWSLRMLARSATGGRLASARNILRTIGSVEAADLSCLAGALRWNIRRARIASDGVSAVDETLDASLALLSLLGVAGERVEHLRRTSAIFNWGELALSVARRLGPTDEIVLFGLGRNGREAAQALTRARIQFCVIDDRENAAQGLTRLRLSDLGPHHVVLVTPDDREGILMRLAAVRARTVCPEYVGLAINGLAA